MTLFRNVVQVVFKQGALSLLHRMTGVTSDKIMVSICEEVEKFGWVELREPVLNQVRCTSASSLSRTMALVLHFDPRLDTPNDISISIGACIVYIACKASESIRLSDLSDLARMAFR